MFRLYVALAALVAAFVVHAQPRPVPDPADPGVVVPVLRHDSALAGYRPAADTKPAPWKAVNDEVAAIGGHAGHATPRAKDAAPSATPKAPQSPPHRH